MVKIRKKEIKDGIVIYYYQPWGKGEEGELFYDSKTDCCGWNKLAENDDALFDVYRRHAYCMLMEYVKSGVYPETDMRIWGL